MDYEKAYKDARQAAKHALDCEKQGLITTDKVLIERMFPELKESEDEKVRKALIDLFTATSKKDWRDIPTEKIIAWLEKQGNNSVKWQNNTPDNKPAINHSVLMKTTQGIAEGCFVGSLWFQFRWSSNIKDDDVLAWMELSDLDEESENIPVIDFKAKDWYASEVDGKIHNANISSEKQSEQETLCDKCRKEQPSHSCQDITELGRCYIEGINTSNNAKSKSKEEILDNWYVEYVYILDYSTGRVIVTKHDVEEPFSELFEQLGLKENQCHYMTSNTILSIEYINF